MEDDMIRIIPSSALVGAPKNIVTSQSYHFFSDMSIDEYYDKYVFVYLEDLFNLY